MPGSVGHIIDINVPEVNPTGTGGGDYETIHADPAAFGSLVGGATRQAGEGIEKAANAGMDILIHRQNLQNEVHANEKLTWYADQATDRWEKFKQLEGTAAVQALPEFKKGLKELNAETMADEPLGVQQHLSRGITSLQDRYAGWAASHAGSQEKLWHDKTATDSAQTFGNQAVLAAQHGTFDDIETSVRKSEDEISKLFEQRGYKGPALEQEVKKFTGQTVRNMVSTLVNDGDVRSAQAVLERYKDRIDAASLVHAGSAIKTARNQLDGRDIADQEMGRVPPPDAQPIAGVPTSFLAAIKQSEGFTPSAKWDYKQYSIGYGTKGAPGETITKEEADKRFGTEIDKAAKFVDTINPRLDPGSRAALTSLTYNASTKWAESGLGEAVRAGDLPAARQRFLEYTKAGGLDNPGLIRRRYQEASWFGQEQAPAGGLPDRADTFERILARTADNPTLQSAALTRMNQIYAVYQREETQGNVAFKQKLNNQMAELSATGEVKNQISEEEFVERAGSPEKGLAAYQEYLTTLRAAADARSLGGMSESEAAAVMQRYTPAPGDDNYAEKQKRLEVLQKIDKQNEAAKKASPAEFTMMHSPAVAAAWQGLTATMQNPQAPVALRQAAARTFADTMLAEQERLGVPVAQRQIVSKQYIDDFVTRLQRPDTAGGAAAVGAQIHAEATLWGEHWPDVYREVAKKAGAPFRVLGSGVMPQAAKALIENEGVKESDILKNEVDPATKLKSITDAVFTAFEPFKKTLTGSEREQTMGDFRNAAVKLATIMVGRGEDQTTAAESAVHQLIGFKYDLNGTYRVPKFQDSGAPQPFTGRDISAGLAEATYQLGLKAGLTEEGGGGPPRLGEGNLDAARRDLKLTPQEEALYRRHLGNLAGPGGVDNKDGSRSSLFALTAGFGDRTYTIPTVHEGKILDPDAAIAAAKREGLDTFPSYASQAEAKARYDALHGYMEKDTGTFLAQRRAAAKFDILPPPDKGEGYSDTFRLQSKLAALRRNGVWINSPDEQGLMLALGDEVVRRKDGTPMFMTWQEIADLARKRPEAR